MSRTRGGAARSPRTDRREASCVERRTEGCVDPRGVAVSTAEPRAAEALEDAIVGLASHRASTVSHLARALALDPELVVGHCLAGFAAKLLGRRDRDAAARASARAAREALEARGGTEREELLTCALERWCARDPEGAIAALEAIGAVEPRDLLAVKLTHALLFLFGRAGAMRRAIERVLPAWSDVPGRGWVLGCHAFALEETGELARAERVGREALAIAPIDPWGAHAVAHVLHTRGAPRDGIAWLDEQRACLEGANNFGAHVAWHRALMTIADGRAEEALALYDERVLLVGSPDYRDLVNAATLLYRLERAGADVGERWETIAELAIARLGDHGSAFADVHCVLALAGAGRLGDARRFVASMRARAAIERGLEAALARDVGVPAAEAMMMRYQAPGGAAALLAEHEAALQGLGGSRAQREIFALVEEDARALGSAEQARAASAERASA